MVDDPGRRISGKFENTGEFHAMEGDVLYAAPMTWHQMGSEAPSGPSIRLALGGYNFINMNNTANQNSSPIFCAVSSSRVLTYVRTLRATLLLTPQNTARRS